MLRQNPFQSGRPQLNEVDYRSNPHAAALSQHPFAMEMYPHTETYASQMAVMPPMINTNQIQTAVRPGIYSQGSAGYLNQHDRVPPSRGYMAPEIYHTITGAMYSRGHPHRSVQGLHAATLRYPSKANRQFEGGNFRSVRTATPEVCFVGFCRSVAFFDVLMLTSAVWVRSARSVSFKGEVLACWLVRFVAEN